MNIPLIIGNLLSLLGSAADTLSSTQKTAKRMLWVQSLGQVFYGIGTFALGGYSGVAQNAVSILRNLVAIKNITNPIIEWILVGLGVALGLIFNNLGVMGLLPVIANLQYTLSIFRFKNNERALKLSFLIFVVLYLIFNVVIYNFVGAALNLVIAVTTASVLIKNKIV